MKNKKKIYILVISTFLVWGIIGYKIVVKILDKKDDTTSAQFIRPTKKQDTLVSDTFSIANNYPDPFLKNDKKIRIKSSVTKKPSFTRMTTPLIWPQIDYNGSIINVTTKVAIANIKINGKERLMKKGETKEDVKLLKILSDSVQVKYKSASKWIIRQ